MNNPLFSPDKPIETIEQDAFDRALFAEYLCKGLQNTKKDCLVVGITGPWGSGKTSLKNMIIDLLAAENKTSHPDESIHGEPDKERRKKKRRRTHPYIVEFDPWMYSGREDLVSLLFDEIASTLYPKSSKIKSFGKKIISSFAFLLEMTSRIVSTGIFGFIMPTLLSGAFKLLAKALRSRSNKVQKNLRKARKTLKKILENQTSHVIVFIDDIDRLTDVEIADMMRTVKSVGDLPNVIYVLLYDPEIVIPSLDEISRKSGKEYLEKIVQVPINLPVLPAQVVQSKLEQQIYHIEKSINTTDRLSYDRPILQACVFPYIKTLRNLNRLMNEIRLRYSALGNHVEIIDLAAITCFEIFDPVLYKWIWEYKQLLVNVDSIGSSNLANMYYYSLSQNQEQELLTALENYPDKENNPIYKDALASLFPSAAQCVKGKYYYMRTRGSFNQAICSNAFDSYFRMNVNPEVISPDVFIHFICDQDFKIEGDVDARVLTSPRLENEIERYLPKVSDWSERAKTLLEYIISHYDIFVKGTEGRQNNFFRLPVALLYLNVGKPNSDIAEQIVETCIRSSEDAVVPLTIYLAWTFKSSISNEEGNQNDNEKLLHRLNEFADIQELSSLIGRGVTTERAKECLRRLTSKILSTKDMKKREPSGDTYSTPTLRYRDLCMLELMIQDLFPNPDEHIRVMRMLRVFTDQDSFAFSIPSNYVVDSIKNDQQTSIDFIDESGNKAGNESFDIDVQTIEKIIKPEEYSNAVQYYIQKNVILEHCFGNQSRYAAYEVALNQVNEKSSKNVVYKSDAEAKYNAWTKKVINH